MSSPIPRLHESARADPQISLLGLRREDVVRVRRGLEAPLSLHQLRKGYQKYSHGRSLICALIPNVPSLDWRPPKADRQLSRELKRVPGYNLGHCAMELTSASKAGYATNIHLPP